MRHKPILCATCRKPLTVKSAHVAPCCGAWVCERCMMRDLGAKWAARKYKCTKCRRGK
jgi:hypothetical protein